MASSTGPRRRRARRAAMLATSLACLAAVAPHSPAAVIPALDQGATINLPTIGSGDVTVLGPSTARLRATLDPGTAATAVYFRYGDGTVLDQRTPSIALTAGTDPTKIVEDLLDLEPGSSYNVQLVVETPAGTVTSQSVPFSTPLDVFVNPTTGGILSVSSKVKNKTRCTIVGTNKRNKLVGTKQRDVICGLGGNDTISGRGGKDLIIAGKGNDRASGGSGNDQLYGNSGRDRLYGNAGSDRFYDNTGGKVTAAKRNGDFVNGGSGRDRAKVNKGDRVRSVERVSRRR